MIRVIACFAAVAIAAYAQLAVAQHAGHVMPMPSSPSQSPAPLESNPAAPAALLPVPTPAMRAAAFPDLQAMDMRGHMDDDPFIATLQFDRLEWQDSGDAQGLGWELRGWAGGNAGRVWLRSEGERHDGSTEDGDLELLWGRPTGPWWDLLAGVRHDFGRGPGRDWLAVGVQGLAPYKFDVAATGYIGQGGRMAARVEADYDVLLTNRLILQPRAEMNLYSRDDPGRGIGKGVSELEVGLRLRYEFSRQVAPYVGYSFTRRFGERANVAGSTGGDDSEQAWVAGLRFWF